MSKISKKIHDNVEFRVFSPFEKERKVDNYYPLGGPLPDEKPIKITLGRMESIPSQMPARHPLDKSY